MPFLGFLTEHCNNKIGLLPEGSPVDHFHLLNDNLGQIKSRRSPSPQLVHSGQRLLVEPLRLGRWLFWPDIVVVTGDEIVEFVLQIATSVIRMKPQTSY